MKRFHISVCTALAAIALASCSDHDVTPDANAGLISYDITTNNTTSRASNIYSSGTNKVNFTVSASYRATADATPQQYFANDKISWSGDNAVYENGQRYWPNTGLLNFFAFHNDTSYTHDGSGTTPTPVFVAASDDELQNTHVDVADVKIEQLAQNQDDILYAVTTDQECATGNVVPLNFRHALAQLNFQFRNRAQTIYVEIQNFALQGIYNKGDLMFGVFDNHKSTEGQYVEGGAADDSHISTVYDGDDSGLVTRCKWTNLSGADDMGNIPGATISALQDYLTGDGTADDYGVRCYLPPKAYNYTGDDKDLTTYRLDTDNLTTSMLVIPQAFNTAEYRQYNGINYRWLDTRLAIRCRIYSIVDTPEEFATAIAGMTSAQIHQYLTDSQNGTVATHGVQIYPKTKDDFGMLVVPLPEITTTSGTDAVTNIGWQAGIKYTYTIIFGGDGDNALDTDNNPQLVKIKVNVTADDWADRLVTDNNVE
jgi:hypothetical protein